MLKKPKMGWLYLLIVLCVLFSGLLAYSLLTKLDDQRESAQTYQELSEEVLVTGATAFADESPTPGPTGYFSEAESEDQSDTVFFLNHDVITVTPTPGPTAVPAVSGAPTGAAVATASERPPAGSGWVVVSPLPAKETAATATPASSSALTGATAAAAAPSPTHTTAPATPIPTAAAAITPIPTAATTAAPPSQTTARVTEEPAYSRPVVLDAVHYSADFGYLQGINEDVKAWLVQDDSPINYPVVQGKDNDEYLDKLFNRKPGKDGSIFLDSGNSDAFEDANTYLYGHHTRTDAMFSTLANYTGQAYYDAHPRMYLLTPYGDYCVDLFAVRVCAVDDETTWRVKQFSRKAEFDAYMAELEGQSLFKAADDALPVWGDQLLVLVTCTNDEHNERYAVYGRMRPIVYASAESVAVTKMTMDRADTLSGLRSVPGRGEMMVYAQNDPLWASMRYESRSSGKHRLFGAGGCGPTSVAMAVANLVPAARLGDIYGYAKNALGYTFCSCSVNQYGCNKLHAQYQVQTEAEYLRYYPLVMASFATGNNMWDLVARTASAGTRLSFIKKIAWLYKLDLAVTTDNDEAIAAVANGSVAIVSLGSQNPLTGGGHYAVLASADAENIYLLDPYRKDDYSQTDKSRILTQTAPGVLAVKRENARALYMSTFYILSATAQTASADPPAVE